MTPYLIALAFILCTYRFLHNLGRALDRYEGMRDQLGDDAP